MADVLREQELREQLAILRPRAKARMRELLLCCGGTFLGFLAVVDFISTKPRDMTAMEAYGASPLIPLLLFGTMMVVAGWLVGTVENHIRQVEAEIQDMNELGY